MSLSVFLPNTTPIQETTAGSPIKKANNLRHLNLHHLMCVLTHWLIFYAGIMQWSPAASIFKSSHSVFNRKKQACRLPTPHYFTWKKKRSFVTSPGGMALKIRNKKMNYLWGLLLCQNTIDTAYISYYAT